MYLFHLWHGDRSIQCEEVLRNNPFQYSVKFAVLALGSTIYPGFCKAGIKLNKMLGDSGMERVATLTTADSLEGRTIQSSIGCISSRIVSFRPVSQ